MGRIDIFEWNDRKVKARKEWQRLEYEAKALKKSLPYPRTKEQTDILDKAYADMMSAWHNWQQFLSIESK